MWIIIAVSILSFFSTCNAGKQTGVYNSDTVLLYKKDTMLIIGNASSTIQLQLPENRKNGYNQNKTLLLLDHPKLIASPDGVYEVYIHLQPTENNSFLPSHKNFVNVLDLYSLTAPEAKDYIEMDISRHIKELVFLQKTLQPLYITVLFRGNILPGGNESTLAGQLLLSGFRIVQIKKGQ